MVLEPTANRRGQCVELIDVSPADPDLHRVRNRNAVLDPAEPDIQVRVPLPCVGLKAGNGSRYGLMVDGVDQQVHDPRIA